MLNFDCGIYAITSPSGKQYIGSARAFRERWQKHLKDLRNNKHHSPGLQHAFNKYGESALRFDKIAIVSRAELLLREQEQIDARDWSQLYNVARIAGSAYGIKRSAETKARVANAKRQQTPETRARISSALKGRKLSTEQIEGMRARASGRKQSDAARAKMSRARKNVPKSDSHAAAIGAALRGKRHTPDRVAAMLAGKAGKLQKNNTSGYAGVYAHKSRWRARTRVAGRLYGIGTFDTPEAANAAIMAFKAKLNQDQ